MDSTHLCRDVGQRNGAGMHRLKNAAAGRSNLNRCCGCTQIRNGSIDSEEMISGSRISSDSIIGCRRGTISMIQHRIIQRINSMFRHTRWLPSISGLLATRHNAIATTKALLNGSFIWMSLGFRVAGTAGMFGFES